MPPTRIKAIILKRIDYRETSVIVHLLTDSIGKIYGLMKGVRSPSKKIPPLAYQQGSCIEAFVYIKPKGGLELVTKPEIIEPFNFDNEKSVFWKKLLLSVDRFIPASRFNSNDIFDLLFKTGALLPEIKNNRPVEVYVTEKILFLLGFGPFLEKCLVCGTKKTLYFFSGKLGGTVCINCQSGQPTCFRLPEKHIDALRFFCKIPLSQIQMIKYIPEGLYKNLMRCLNEIIRYHIEE